MPHEAGEPWRGIVHGLEPPNGHAEDLTKSGLYDVLRRIRTHDGPCQRRHRLPVAGPKLQRAVVPAARDSHEELAVVPAHFTGPRVFS